jgi:hypothetical protein
MTMATSNVVDSGFVSESIEIFDKNIQDTRTMNAVVNGNYAYTKSSEDYFIIWYRFDGANSPYSPFHCVGGNYGERNTQRAIEMTATVLGDELGSKHTLLINTMLQEAITQIRNKRRGYTPNY